MTYEVFAKRPNVDGQVLFSCFLANVSGLTSGCPPDVGRDAVLQFLLNSFAREHPGQSNAEFRQLVEEKLDRLEELARIHQPGDGPMQFLVEV